ncbi:PREDICTED: protein FAR1-RELATED SEQUENCE 5-like [Ipomoea nil]|uniref:protein FAR1-RELATED SEQUENCE 5-like n=1 Tax=Ipomoea nil TaxID=35883 RepID=UPI000900A61E|nr:PREDICTED: protein FAR1-RELATED SEQUENCE 5-like [Ipomoea nil]
MARIVFKRDKTGRYVVTTFEEAHTHCLCEESYKPFLKVNRKLDVGYQQFITKCSKVNVGASKSFDIYAEMVGGVENVGCTQQDFKNYRREVLAYMQGRDAQMVISKYLDIKCDYSDMYFEYEANEKDQLARVFWADGVARQKFCAFGDVVSFNATYKTNRYSLVFVPFTGIDNHKKCVTFAAALIAKEDVESYCWALRHFKIAMGSIPRITVTDQDPAMKVAITKEFPETRHRYCMWHIMTKVSDKVSPDLARNEEFRRELNDVVWNDSATSEYFEVAWKGVIEKYALHENAWLKRTYEEREKWVPACFENVFMGGLLRTTSRSEAENRIFRTNTNKHMCLSEFFIRLESTIRKQWIIEADLSGACNAQTPPFKTQLRIEQDAAAQYTLTVFYEVQDNICVGCFDCRVRSVKLDGPINTYVVEDEYNKIFTVIVENGTDTTTCTCRMYTRIGLLCSHAYAVLIYERIDQTPPQHINPRWTKTALKNTNVVGNDSLQHARTSSTNSNQESTIVNLLYRCLGLAQGDSSKLEPIRKTLEDFEATLSESGRELGGPDKGKQVIMESYCGVPEPDEINVHPPPVSSNKGSGKRMRTAKEIAMKEQSKKKRTCKTCGLATGHNSRSCPQK